MLFAATSLGCASSAPVAPAAPAAESESRLLSSPDFALDRAERLQASVDVFGISLGTLDSRLCPGRPDAAATVETRVVPSRLVRAIRQSSGRARTEITAGLGEPRVSDYRFVEGDLLRHYEVSYRPGRYEYVYDNGGRAKRRGRIDVPGGAYPHDMHSAMALIRAWRPRLGERAHLFAVLGRRLWRVDLRALGPEVIKVAGSPRLAQRIEGHAVRLWQAETNPRERSFSVWVSDDDARVPLHLSAETALGAVTIRLTDHSRTSEPCQRDSPARLVRASAP